MCLAASFCEIRPATREISTTVSGVTDHVADTETEAIGRLREIVFGFGALRRVARPPFAPAPPADDPSQLPSLVPVAVPRAPPLVELSVPVRSMLKA